MSPTDISLILAGPILRRLTRNRIVLWLATSRELEMTFCLYRHQDGDCFFAAKVMEFSPVPVRIGEQAYIYIINYVPDQPLVENELLEYDLLIETDRGQQSLKDLIPDLLYQGQTRPVFTIKSRLEHILHGSCRKPHYPSEDGLLRVDDELENTFADVGKRPSLLLMTGDQIYADDVGGPMLAAIHQVCKLLGLSQEILTGAVVGDSEELQQSELCYYRREELLPQSKETKTLRDRFFGGVRKPIFTAASAHNHLVTFSEVAAMYLLIWSPELWKFVDLDGVGIDPAFGALYESERVEVEGFARGLSRIRRCLAHLPVYMIFDDHDVTDDWNLTRGWEEVAYDHPFSKRIIGNSLIAYFLFQGWGNSPQLFDKTFLEKVYNCFEQPGGGEQDSLIDHLLSFESWN